MTLNIAMAALNQTPLDWEGNRQRILAAITQSHQNGAQITLLPELCISGYGCEDRFCRDDVLEKSWDSLLKLTPQVKGVALVGLPVRFSNKTYNCVAVIQDGKILGLNAKRVLAKTGVYYEPRWFTAWENGRQEILEKSGLNIPIGDLVYQFSGARVGVEICEEAWINPSYPMRSAVDLVLNPSASHFEIGKESIRRSIVERQSKFHNCYYAYTNLVGLEAGRLIYDGSMMVANRGRLLASSQRLGFKDVYVMHCSFDIRSVDSTSPGKISETGSPQQEFLNAEALGLFDYLRKTKSQGFLISLSGGRDSSCAVILVQHMIAAARQELGDSEFFKRQSHLKSKDFSKILSCIYQATENSSTATLEASRALCQEFGVQFHEADIQPLVDHCLKFAKEDMKVALDWDNREHDTSMQNLQARCRVQLPWLIANLEHRIFLTTTNRSELAVGYMTMDGDSAGAFAPIGGVSKDFINGFLRELQAGKLHGMKPVAALNQVLKVPATAELKPAKFAQEDEKDLMPFPVLARIEELYLRDRQSPEQIVKTLSIEFPNEPMQEQVAKFVRLWNHSQWKRERVAPSFHLASHSTDPKTWCRQPILVHSSP